METFVKVVGIVVAAGVAVLGVVNAPDFNDQPSKPQQEVVARTETTEAEAVAEATTEKGEEPESEEFSAEEADPAPAIQESIGESIGHLQSQVSELQKSDRVLVDTLRGIEERMKRLSEGLQHLHGRQGFLEDSVGEIQSILGNLAKEIQNVSANQEFISNGSARKENEGRTNESDEAIRAELSRVATALSHLQAQVDEAALYGPPNMTDRRCSFKLFVTKEEFLEVANAPFRIPPGVKEGDFIRYLFYLPQLRASAEDETLRNSTDPRDNWIRFPDDLTILPEHFLEVR